MGQLAFQHDIMGYIVSEIDIKNLETQPLQSDHAVNEVKLTCRTFNGLFSVQSEQVGTIKVRPIWILMKQEIMGWQ